MNKQRAIEPLLMNYQALTRTLFPYCHGKKVLIQAVKDIWASATPIPNSATVKIIMPQQFISFVELAMKENG